jgi:hypothetical protein
MATARLLGVVLLLASLDLIGSVLLKEAMLRRSPVLAIAGAGVFVFLAMTLALALEVAELSLVSLGWIVLLQVAVMVVDATRYGYTPGRVQLVAICVAMLALVVAVVAPPAPPRQDPPPPTIPGPRAASSLEDEILGRVAYRHWKKYGTP